MNNPDVKNGKKKYKHAHKLRKNFRDCFWSTMSKFTAAAAAAAIFLPLLIIIKRSIVIWPTKSLSTNLPTYLLTCLPTIMPKRLKNIEIIIIH
jgi:hypothetical protein